VTGSCRRIGAILWSDFLVRYRSPSTVVVFLLLCFSAYLWVPDPSAGYTLMSIEGQRVLYNSAAMAFGTALLFSLLVALVGFYLVKGSIGRDLRTRCGVVIASTPTANWEYLVGKCLGSILFLASLAVGYLMSSMVMQLVRGEAPLDPVPYLVLYALLVPPAIVFVSVVALLFEAWPPLAGRAGEVGYFFLWSLLLTVSIAWQTQGTGPGLFFDFTGIGFLQQVLHNVAGAESFSLGAATFDATKEPLVFEAVRVEPRWILARLASTLAPAPILLLAVVVFHRFDPTRARSSRRRDRTGMAARVTHLVQRPASLALSLLLPGFGSRPSLAGSTISEAQLILLLHPLAATTLGLILLASMVAPVAVLTRIVLPATFVILAVALADASCREGRSGTMGLIASAPKLEKWYVWWKLSAALLVGLPCTAVAAVRLLPAAPGSALSVLIGLLFTAATATALGILAGTPRALVVLYLSFWYVVLNDGGRTPALDFAGFYGTATISTRILYLTLAILLLLIAQAVHSLRRTSAS